MARRRAEGPGRAMAPPRARQVTRTLRQWARRHAQARQAGIDLRKKAFLSKLLSTGCALLTVGAASVMTVLTGGAATPVLAVASVRAALLIADCWCAWVHWQRAVRVPPEPPLPMGGNFLGNVVYRAAIAAGVGPLRARECAAYGSGALLVALAATGMGLSLGLSADTIPPEVTAMRYAAGAGSLLSLGTFARAADGYDPAARRRDEAAADLFKEILERAVTVHGAALRVRRQGQLGETEGGAARRRQVREMTRAFATWIEDMRDGLASAHDNPQLQADFERILAAACTTAVTREFTADGVMGADRDSMPLRVVNDVILCQVGTSMAVALAAQAGWAA